MGTAESAKHLLGFSNAELKKKPLDMSQWLSAQNEKNAEERRFAETGPDQVGAERRDPPYRPGSLPYVSVKLCGIDRRPHS
ncbi:hypothetical protein N0V92_009541 [Colletotrichum tropicale]|nr:hypothetical protein N0V92_009541 [Colletotrichum tropicale]